MQQHTDLVLAERCGSHLKCSSAVCSMSLQQVLLWGVEREGVLAVL